ncbi:energy transducer TonB [Sulfurimonas sp. SAG-AH-194-I05]|nr:energy transducer TonB [Sulfurimonas sp. SAG-AH-194-I05]MDF1874895.1 energy transducer TonB [Sulfurimonas sp. SAG-AH-194-I05]
MNRSSFAFFVALLLHILFILLFLILGTLAPEIKKPVKEKKFKISLKEIIPKGSQLKHIVKKPMIYTKKKTYRAKKIIKKPIKKPIKKVQKRLKKSEKPKKILKKAIKKVLKQKLFVEKKLFIPLNKPLKKERITTPTSWLYEDKSDQEIIQNYKPHASANSMHASSNIRKLYGTDFNTLTQGQQKYIIDNQEIMRRITQEVLNRQAQVSDIYNLRVNTHNIIEFYLHPNGDMTDFKFLQKSNYYTLDDLTKATIEFAYSKYPIPEEKVLIRYNVIYNLR